MLALRIHFISIQQEYRRFTNACLCRYTFRLFLYVQWSYSKSLFRGKKKKIPRLLPLLHHNTTSLELSQVPKCNSLVGEFIARERGHQCPWA